MNHSNEILYPIILNSSNLVQGSNWNSTYRYQFPVGSVKFKTSKHCSCWTEAVQNGACIRITVIEFE